MPKSNQSKVLFAQDLLNQGISYREIQEKLREKFGSGMSNSSLQKLVKRENEIKKLKEKNYRLEAEIEVWKSLYFELKEITELTSKKNEKGMKKSEQQ